MLSCDTSNVKFKKRHKTRSPTQSQPTFTPQTAKPRSRYNLTYTQLKKMDISNFTNAQNETLAILLSEGFDYNASYEASIFYGDNLIYAREYAKTQSKSSHPNIIKETPSNMSIFLFIDVRSPTYSHTGWQGGTVPQSTLFIDPYLGP